MISFLYALLIFYLAFAFGQRLLHRLKLSDIQRIVFSFGVGLAFFSMTLFVLAAVHLLAFRSVIALILLVLFWLLPDFDSNLALFRRGFRSSIPFFCAQFKRPFSMALTLLFFALIVMQFLAVFAPPSSTDPGPKDWDSLSYHFAVAKIYVQEKGFTFLSLPHANWPMGMEMLYALGLILYTISVSKLFSFGIGMLLLLSIYALAREHVSSFSAFVGASVFASIPLVQAFFGTGYIDLSLAFFELLAIWSFLKWWRHESWDWLFLSALFAGFSAAIKTLGGWILILLGLALLYKLARAPSTKSFVQRLKALTGFGVVSAVFFVPWYWKTFAYTGNPVWPLYYSFLERFEISGDGTAFFNVMLQDLSVRAGIVLGNPLLELALIPFSLTFFGSAFNGIISPLYLAILPALFLVNRMDADIKKLIGFAAGFVVLWFFTFQESRFIFPALAILSIPVALAYDRLRREKWISTVLSGIILLTMIFAVVFTFAYKAPAFAVAIGFESSHDYLMRAQPNYGTLQWASRNLPPESKLFFFRDTHGYYSDLSYEYGIYEDFNRFQDADDLRDWLRSREFTHVLVNENTVSLVTDRERRKDAVMDAFLKKHAILSYSHQRVSLYALNG
ncbi:glycosyltransferase family 39 protein [Candidatus Micrarchaeota archaeon]|nr:glycosyltransferase family 39 protein [Candidatus Micrarchaeota archaeon]